MKSGKPTPPVAKRVPHRLEKHGHVRQDDYYWLRDRESPEVIAYLEAENAYADEVMAHTLPLQAKLYDEIVARIPQLDESVPIFVDGYFYYHRFEPGRDYAVYARRRSTMESPEEVMIDVNELAAGHGYFDVSDLSVTTDGEILAFATDAVGRRIYTLQFRNLHTGEALNDRIPDMAGNFAWANDNRTIFYTRQDPETLRWNRVYRHVLGSDPARDELVFEEHDDTFNAFVYRTRSRQFLVIGSSQTVTDEYLLLEADDPGGRFRIFQPRERGREYSIDHLGDSFYIRTNDGARNFRLMKTPVTATQREHWEEVVPHREDIFLEEFEIFRSHLVLAEMADALPRLHVMTLSGGEGHFIEVDEPAYVISLGANPNIDSTVVRYVYSSMTTPDSTFDYDMETRSRTLKKRQNIGGGFDSSEYVTERIFATARDGKRIPISLLYRKGFSRFNAHPVYLYAYGSYGISTEPSFEAPVFSLVDRGFVFALAHIRGGQEMGREWYESGRQLSKMNTFSDFIDAADHLVSSGYADPANLFASGGSAGGLLVGAVMNLRPELFKGVVTRVPFVDVVTTMLDEDIPLTTGEYDEWGNPNDREFYEYMLSYSPYDHIGRHRYPNLLVTTGLHDSQVQYWEPAKWVAKLRATKTGDEVVLLKTEMEAGHSGPSGRFRRHRITAMNYAFVLDLAGRAGV